MISKQDERKAGSPEFEAKDSQRLINAEQIDARCQAELQAAEARTTMIDHVALVLYHVARRKKRLENDTAGPTVIKQVEKYKMAAPCQEQCIPADKCRINVCNRCKILVYNFSRMNQTEAESLVFTREERRDLPLYKRADGRFLTRNCPVGLAIKRRKILGLAGTLLAALILGFLSLSNRPEPAPTPKIPGAGSGVSDLTTAKEMPSVQRSAKSDASARTKAEKRAISWISVPTPRHSKH